MTSRCPAFWTQRPTAGPPQLGASDAQHGTNSSRDGRHAGQASSFPCHCLHWGLLAARAGHTLQKEADPQQWAGEKKHPEAEQLILFSLWARDQPLSRCCLTNLMRAAFSLTLVGVALYTDQEENVPLINQKSLSLSHCVKRVLANYPSLFRSALFPHRERLAWKLLKQMKSSQQLWENCLYVCVNLIEKCALRFKCLIDFFFF